MGLMSGPSVSQWSSSMPNWKKNFFMDLALCKEGGIVMLKQGRVYLNIIVCFNIKISLHWNWGTYSKPWKTGPDQRHKKVYGQECLIARSWTLLLSSSTDWRMTVMRTYFLSKCVAFVCIYVSGWRAGAHTAPYHSLEWHIGGPHQSAVHPSDNWSPLAPSTPLWDLCVSALVDSCSSPALLRFTLMFNPILTVSSFSPRSRSASHEYPKVCLLDRIIPLFKATGDDSSATKNTLNGSSALSHCFSGFPLLSLSLPSVFVPLGFY